MSNGITEATDCWHRQAAHGRSILGSEIISGRLF